MGSYADGAVSLDELLQEPVSDVSADNTGEPEEQSPLDDHLSLADLSGCNQDDGYVRQEVPMMWSDPSNGDQAYYPLRTYGNRNHANRTLSAEEFCDTGNDTNAYSGQQQAYPSDGQSLYLQTNGLPAPQQVDDNMPFYEASSNHKWVDEKDDYANVNDLIYPPMENGSPFDVDVGDDILGLLDTTVDDFELEDLLGPLDGSNCQLPAISNFDQKVCCRTVTCFSLYS